MIKDLLTYINESPTPFHCVYNTVKKLEEAGFTELFLEDQEEVKPGKYFITKNESSIIAFILPEAVSKINVIGAHTDSPNLKLRHRPSFQKAGYGLLSVETYGGVLLHTWLDRDLSMAGRVFIKEENSLVSKLIEINRPFCRIPSLAIHLNRNVNKEGLKIHSETELRPIFSLGEDEDQLETLIAEVAQCDPDQIVSHDLSLYEMVPPVLSGAKNEFIHSARLDNQASCHAGLTALLSLKDVGTTCTVLALFDHEEVGSTSSIGADGVFLTQTIESVLGRFGIPRQQYLSLLSQSSFLSADMAHAVHPNFEAQHGEHHKPMLNAGPVIKVNENLRYATNAETKASFITICEEKNIPYQIYHHRNDIPCGSTIGPSVASQLGMKTIDVGNAMLSMHSIREMAGTQDHEPMINAMIGFYEIGL